MLEPEEKHKARRLFELGFLRGAMYSIEEYVEAEKAMSLVVINGSTRAEDVFWGVRLGADHQSSVFVGQNEAGYPMLSIDMTR